MTYFQCMLYNVVKGKVAKYMGHLFVLLKVYSQWGKVAAVLPLACGVFYNANVANVASVNTA
jgi:hypothetical protein